MKVLICGICGGKDVDRSLELGGCPFGIIYLVPGSYFCWHCNREIIPLVTPQEVRNEEKECPELKKIGAGDEIGYFCKLVDSRCLKEYGYPCPEYDRIMKELKEEQ